MSVKIISIAIFDNFNLQIVILLLFSSFFYNVCNFSFVCKCVIKCCWGKKKQIAGYAPVTGRRVSESLEYAAYLAGLYLNKLHGPVRVQAYNRR